MNVAARYARAVSSLGQGRADEAEALCVDIIRHHPQHADALQLLGLVALQRGDSAAGIRSLSASLQANPRNPFAHCNLGNALLESSQVEAALEHFRRALELMPAFAGGHYSQGNALMNLQRHSEALESFDRALSCQGNYPEALNNRGNALLALAEPERALESYQRAVQLRPAFALALANCAKVLIDSSRFQEALRVLDRLVLLQPDDAQTFYDRGQCWVRLEGSDQALQDFDRALMLRPDFAAAWYARGMILRARARHEDALNDFERALVLSPASVDILYRKAEALRDLQRFKIAAEAFAEVLRRDPERDFALGNLIQARLQICDWTDYAKNVQQALRAVAEGKRVYLPGPFFSVSTSDQQQWQCARTFANRQRRFEQRGSWNLEPYAHERIRIAYVSADFREHPVSTLMVGVLEHHDRRRFEISGISLLPAQDSAVGRRVKAAFDQFIEVDGRTDLEIASHLRAQEIDIAVDLMGSTGRGRPAIFAHRPAPVQVSYLGYTGTMASCDLDYLIADENVVPPAQQQWYSEKIVYLPDSYQPSDARRSISREAPTRAQCGLPARGVVFCCFNTHYKISPGFFAMWMRLLGEIPGSVLWLSAAAPDTASNLRRAATSQGIDSARLVFADRLANSDEHLARLPLADLFLDTLPFNAHATASDALWAGLPVLTCRGDTFAGRVASSLLSAARLPELITTTTDDYLALALRLARYPDELAALRARLIRERYSCALFDTVRYCRHLEAAYTSMWRKIQQKEPLTGFAIGATPASEKTEDRA